MRALHRLIAAIAIAFLCGAAAAQNTLTFDLSIGPDSTLTWTTTPAADACQASGSWSGALGPSGSQSVGRIDGGRAFVLACSWSGDSMAVLTWTNPTENTDGSPYTDPAVTRIVWAEGAGSTVLFDCMAPAATPGIQTTDRPAGQTMHTVTGLTPGDWEFGAYAVNQQGVCSVASNRATKTTSATADVTNTISVTVPAAITGLGAN